MASKNRKLTVLIISFLLLISPIASLVSAVGAQEPDEFEPDNSFSQYSSMTVTTEPSSQDRSIAPEGDNDYIRFFATPGHYTFYTEGYTDTYGELFDSDQKLLVSDDDSGATEVYQYQFKITYKITTPGYYFLRVTGYDDTYTTGDYTLIYYYELATLSISPSEGPGGAIAKFSGSGYPASSPVNIEYYDSTLNAWNTFQATTADPNGDITISAGVPDLKKSLSTGDNYATSQTISFRALVDNTPYCYANYTQYFRGIKTIGAQTAQNLFGNGTNLAGSLVVEPTDTIALCGEWFHANSVITVKYDGETVVNAATEIDWANAAIIGTTTANPAGSFETAITIPPSNPGIHHLSIEDSQTRLTLSILVTPIADWTQTYDTTNPEGAIAAIKTTDGGYALVGATYPNEISDIWLVKTDFQGNMLWNKTFGGTGDDYPYSIIQTNDGGYAITGYTNSNNEGDFSVLFIKTDASGNLQYNNTYNHTGDDIGYSIIQDSEGGYFIVGSHDTAQSGKQILFIQTDPQGNAIWMADHGYSGNDVGKAVIHLDDGSYTILGETTSFGSMTQIYLLNIDSSGEVTWERTYGGHLTDLVYSITTTSDGGYAIAGTTNYLPEDFDIYILKIDSTGHVDWTFTYNATKSDYAYSIIENDRKEFVIAGAVLAPNQTNTNAILLKLDWDGNLSANHTWTEPASSFARQVIQSSDGNYVVAGASLDASNYDFWLTKTSALTSMRVHNLNTNQSYSSIQKAIDSASTQDGHTIAVDSGFYRENVVIHKSITLMGENNISTIIDGSNKGNVISIIADNVELTGFTIQNSNYYSITPCSGIYIGSVTNANVRDNIVKNTDYGMSFNGASSSTATENQILYSYGAFNVEHSANILLSSNQLSNYGWYDLRITNSSVNLQSTSNNDWINCLSNGNSTINTNGTLGYVELTQDSSLQLQNAHYIDALDICENADLTISNSTVDGLYLAYSSSATLYDTTVELVYLLSIDSNLSLTGIPSGRTGNFNLSDYISIASGATPDLVLTNSRVDILKFYFEDSTVTVTDCQDIIVEADNSNITVRGRNPGSYVGTNSYYDTSILTLENTTIKGIEVSATTHTTIHNSKIQRLDLEYQASVSAYDSTIDRITCIDFNGTLMLSNVTGISFGAFDSNVTLQGNFAGYRPSVSNSQVNRTYTVVTKDLAGNPEPNIELQLYDQFKNPIWNGYTDSNGITYLDVVFTDTNCTSILTIKAIKNNQTEANQKISFQAPTIVPLTLENAKVHNLNTGLSYFTIQDAIDANQTLDGHEIFVEEGLYQGNLTIDKSIKLRGENNASTIIDGATREITIQITANDVEVSGFTILNSEDNDNTEGISIISRSGVNITNNIFKQTYAAISADSSSHVTISRNTFFIDVVAIIMGSSSECLIDTNTLIGTTDENGGVLLAGCYNVTISNNEFVTAAETSWGLNLLMSQNCLVSGNSFADHESGIVLTFSQNNTIYHNYFTQNLYSAAVLYSMDNTFYHNFFLNNTNDPALPVNNSNVWDNGYPTGGNYWSNYTGTDTDQDGIGDTPYILGANNTDRYPLVYSQTEFDAGQFNQTQCNINTLSNSSITNFQINPQTKTLSFTLTGETATTGFTLITIPNALMETLYHNIFTVYIDGQPCSYRAWSDQTNTYLYVTYTHSTHTLTVVGDTTAPVTTDDYDGQWHTQDFTINLQAHDQNGIAETYYKINGGNTQSVSADGQPRITTEGQNTLEYWSVDMAGNTENHKTLTAVKLDKTAPTGSILINNGVSHASNALVTLSLTAYDQHSGVRQMRFSDDGTSWSSWELATASKSWYLTGDAGTKTVYYQVQDYAGLISETYSDSIILMSSGSSSSDPSPTTKPAPTPSTEPTPTPTPTTTPTTTPQPTPTQQPTNEQLPTWTIALVIGAALSAIAATAVVWIQKRKH